MEEKTLLCHIVRNAVSAGSVTTVGGVGVTMRVETDPHCSRGPAKLSPISQLWQLFSRGFYLFCVTMDDSRSQVRKNSGLAGATTLHLF